MSPPPYMWRGSIFYDTDERSSNSPETVCLSDSPRLSPALFSVPVSPDDTSMEHFLRRLYQTAFSYHLGHFNFTWGFSTDKNDQCLFLYFAILTNLSWERDTHKHILYTVAGEVRLLKWVKTNKLGLIFPIPQILFSQCVYNIMKHYFSTKTFRVIVFHIDLYFTVQTKQQNVSLLRCSKKERAKNLNV